MSCQFPVTVDRYSDRRKARRAGCDTAPQNFSPAGPCGEYSGDAASGFQRFFAPNIDRGRATPGQWLRVFFHLLFLARLFTASRAVQRGKAGMYHGEKLNAWTHLVGAVLALAGSVVLVVLAVHGGDPWKIVSVSIYGATLVLLYTFSAMYHSFRGRAKDVLRKLDHQGIYLLIAGSYTPFCLVTLRGPWGWSLFALVWGLALVGGLQEMRPRSEARTLSLVIYIVMGWAVLAALVPLLEALGTEGFVWVAAGGLLYTGGIVFYVLDTRLRHAHGVWHLFVMAGSAAHYFAILFYVL
jgi:hemolysin III